MQLTTDQWAKVHAAAGVQSADVSKWAQPFSDTFKDGMFRNAQDMRDFLVTVYWESGRLHVLREDGRYTAERLTQLGNAAPAGSRWRSLVPRANELAGNEYKFFEACYGGRMGNGPEGSGDGAAYPGEGLVQVTGKYNYQWLADKNGQDLVMMQQLLLQPHFTIEFCYSWWVGHIPESILGDIPRERRIINGGTNGLQQVQALALKIDSTLQALT